MPPKTLLVQWINVFILTNSFCSSTWDCLMSTQYVVNVRRQHRSVKHPTTDGESCCDSTLLKQSLAMMWRRNQVWHNGGRLSLSVTTYVSSLFHVHTLFYVDPTRKWMSNISLGLESACLNHDHWLRAQTYPTSLLSFFSLASPFLLREVKCNGPFAFKFLQHFSDFSTDMSSPRTAAQVRVLTVWIYLPHTDLEMGIIAVQLRTTTLPGWLLWVISGQWDCSYPKEGTSLLGNERHTVQ